MKILIVEYTVGNERQILLCDEGCHLFIIIKYCTSLQEGGVMPKFGEWNVGGLVVSW